MGSRSRLSLARCVVLPQSSERGNLGMLRWALGKGCTCDPQRWNDKPSRNGNEIDGHIDALTEKDSQTARLTSTPPAPRCLLRTTCSRCTPRSLSRKLKNGCTKHGKNSKGLPSMFVNLLGDESLQHITRENIVGLPKEMLNIDVFCKFRLQVYSLGQYANSRAQEKYNNARVCSKHDWIAVSKDDAYDEILAHAG